MIQQDIMLFQKAFARMRTSLDRRNALNFLNDHETTIYGLRVFCKVILSPGQQIEYVDLDDVEDLDTHEDLKRTPTDKDQIYYSQFMNALRTAPHFPYRSMVLVERKLNEKKANQTNYVDCENASMQALKALRVIVVRGECPTTAKLAEDKKGWAFLPHDEEHPSWRGMSSERRPTVEGQNFIIHHYHPLRDSTIKHSSVDVLFDYDTVVTQYGTGHWLLDPGRDPLEELSEAQLEELQLDQLNYHKLKLLMPFARFDYRGWAGWNEQAGRAKRSARLMLKVLKSWQRSGPRAAEGVAVGMQYRNDQQGNVGHYETLKAPRDPNAVFENRRRQNLLLNFLIGLTGAFKTFTQHMQSETRRAKMAGCGVKGIATVGATMRGYDAKLHIEGADDPTYTNSVCLGAYDDNQTPAGAFDFALAAIDGGYGVVMQSGPRIAVVFSGKRNVHGTSFYWEEDSPEVAESDGGTAWEEEEEEEEEDAEEASDNEDEDDFDPDLLERYAALCQPPPEDRDVTEEEMEVALALLEDVERSYARGEVMVVLEDTTITPAMEMERMEGESDAELVLRLRGGARMKRSCTRVVAPAGQREGVCSYAKASMVKRGKKKQLQKAGLQDVVVDKVNHGKKKVVGGRVEMGVGVGPLVRVGVAVRA